MALSDPVFPATGRFQEKSDIFTWTRNGWQPRIGLSYRLGERTVLRAGGGIYGNEPSGLMLLGVLLNPRANAGFRIFQASPAQPNLLLSNPFDSNVQIPGSGLDNASGYQSPLPQSYVPSWGLSIQHQLSDDAMVEVGYDGTRSVHQMRLFEFNDAVPGPGNRQLRRPWPTMQTYQLYMGNGDQSYHGFNFQLTKRPGPEGIVAFLSYTWAKSLDTTGGRIPRVGDPWTTSRNFYLNGRANRGRGEANIPGRLGMLAGWDIPFGPGRAHGADTTIGKILGGWSLYSGLRASEGTVVYGL